MGTGANMSTAEKIAALAARRTELESLLAAKNEELYSLCVQEVQLTGVVPPEAPLSPESGERRGSVRSATASDGDTDSAHAHARRRLPDKTDHKLLAHRLSTPSISGTTRSAHSRPRRELPRTDVPAPDTFSIPSSQTYPNLAPRKEPAVPPPQVYRHRTLTTDYMNKIYYAVAPETQSAPRMRETHFSSSHPDIASYQQASSSTQPADHRTTPLIYQYASQLKAQSHHLGGLVHPHVHSKRRDPGRRSTLQRTQTYHLTAHSDYPAERPAPPRPRPDMQPEQAQCSYLMMERSPSMVSAVPARSQRPLPEEPFTPDSVSTGYAPSSVDDLSTYRYSMNDKPKEKHWYETSLDSPTESVPVESPPRPGVKRSPSVGITQGYEVMTQGVSNPVSPRSEVLLESPKNCTVVEQGKWIPYREVTKPFEMSDFYKYSTKFRQTNQNAGANLQALGNASRPVAYRYPPEVPQFTQEHWHAPNH